jgi:hypothetical protein
MSEFPASGSYIREAAGGNEASGGGGGGPIPIGIIDFENNAYSWGGVTKSRADLAGAAAGGGWAFNPANLTTEGYEGSAEFALVNEALTAVIAGCVMVFDSTVDASGTVSLELYDAPGFNTDAKFVRGAEHSSAYDGNGGGSGDTATGQIGRVKASFLVSSTVQQASDNGGAAATCTPAVVWPVTPTVGGMTVAANCIMHAVIFYAEGTDLQVVSSPDGIAPESMLLSEDGDHLLDEQGNHLFGEAA